MIETQRRFEIVLNRDRERHFYHISLTDEGRILASCSGINETTVLHMFVTLCADALLSVPGEAKLNDRLAILERFSKEIVFKPGF